MKVTILDLEPGEEEEIIVKCDKINDNLQKILNSIKQGNDKLNLYKNGDIYFIEPDAIYYFESVDNKTFIYCMKEVYESKLKLYEIDSQFKNSSFFRASKSTILNLSKIKNISPAFNGRFEAVLKNNEKVIISRQFVPELKRKLGL